MKKEIEIKGMTCPACKALVEDVCSDFSEVNTATVDLKKGTLLVDVDEKFDFKSLKEEIESAGSYKVIL